MRCLWKLWVSTATEKALRAFEAVRGVIGAEALNRCTGADPKTAGFLIRFETEIGAESWNDGGVEVIARAQRIGRAWILAGEIRGGPSGWSKEPRVPGVRAIEWSLIAATPANGTH